MQLLQYNKITMQHNTKISADISLTKLSVAEHEITSYQYISHYYNWKINLQIQMYKTTFWIIKAIWQDPTHQYVYVYRKKSVSYATKFF
jgi:hypothetical protein